MKKIAVILLIGLWSCKTYTKSTCILSIDRYDYKMTVWETYRYDRKTDTLVRHSIDTVITAKTDESNLIMQQSTNQLLLMQLQNKK